MLFTKLAAAALLLSCLVSSAAFAGDLCPHAYCTYYNAAEDKMIDRSECLPSAGDSRFKLKGKEIRLEMKNMGDWSSGSLNGKPAMGFSPNRGWHIFSTVDLTERFEYWYSSNCKPDGAKGW